MRDEFIQAVIDNNVGTVRRELSNGRDPNLRDQYGWIALHRAAANDSVEVGRLLIAAGSSLAATGTDEWTPLHLAAVSGSAGMVRLLVDSGADVHALSKIGNTPLHLCGVSGNVQAAETLIRAGASVNAKNMNGLTPRKSAERSGPWCDEFRALLDRLSSQ